MDNAPTMDLDELEEAVTNLGTVINDFPIGAVSLEDLKPVSEKIQATRKSLMHLHARLLMLRAKQKRNLMRDDDTNWSEEDLSDALQSMTSEMLINARAIKLCLHSTTIISILANKEGDKEDKRKIEAYLQKLFTLNDAIMAVQKSIEAASQEQLDLKLECQEALSDYQSFLKQQEQIRSRRLQETNPEIVKNKDKMEKTLRKINVLKKLIRNFIAASGNVFGKDPILLQMLENHRDLLNVETIMKMSRNSESNES